MRSKRIVARRPAGCLILLVLSALAAAPVVRPDTHVLLAQSAASQANEGEAKKPLTVDDYDRWRDMGQERISGDGRWVAYVLRHVNVLAIDAKPVLFIRDLETGRDIEIQNAHSPEFSPDSRWIVYQVDSVRVRGGRGGRAGQQGAPADTAAVTPPGSSCASSRPARRGRGSGCRPPASTRRRRI